MCLLLRIGDPRTGIRAATPVDGAGEGACLGDVEVAGFPRLMGARDRLAAGESWIRTTSPGERSFGFEPRISSDFWTLFEFEAAEPKIRFLLPPAETRTNVDG